MVAMKAGFSTIPITHFEIYSRDNYQLYLIEQYILRLNMIRDKHTVIKNDFKYLLDEPKVDLNSNESVSNNHSLP